MSGAFKEGMGQTPPTSHTKQLFDPQLKSNDLLNQPSVLFVLLPPASLPQNLRLQLARIKHTFTVHDKGGYSSIQTC